MKTIKFSRFGFPNESMWYWATYFIWLLEKKYNVEIDAENPDLVLFSNSYCNMDAIDTFLGTNPKPPEYYGKNVKKLFVSGEIFQEHMKIINRGDDWFAIGPGPLETDHPRYLRLQIHNTTAAWGLYSESKIKSTPYDWLLEKKSGEEILNSKKHFCGVVQNSTIPYRVELFEKLSEYKFVRAAGSWITNVPQEELPEGGPGDLDGVSYRGKVNFLSSCKFSIDVQSSFIRYFSHEKLIQSFAANTIPIFWGNPDILEDGFNPNRFINCHEFETVGDVVQRVIEIDNDDDLYKEIVSEPIFVNNELPYYFDDDYLLSFLETILEK